MDSGLTIPRMPVVNIIGIKSSRAFGLRHLLDNKAPDRYYCLIYASQWREMLCVGAGEMSEILMTDVRHIGLFSDIGCGRK